jgi:hypothetical protein
MAPEWGDLIHAKLLYRPKELGGKGKGERGLLGISYDTVIRIFEDMPGVIIRREKVNRTILIPGWVILRWIREHLKK